MALKKNTAYKEKPASRYIVRIVPTFLFYSTKCPEGDLNPHDLTVSGF
jgi:hypothetical protein